MAIHYRRDGNAIIILGTTYPYREAIKALGARFAGQDKTWILPFSPEALTQVDSLCSASGGGCLTGGQETSRTQKLEPSANLLPIDPIPGDPAPDETTEGGPPGLSLNEKTLSISQLVTQVSEVISAKFSFPIWIVGEIQNLSNSGKGAYFSFAEPRETAQGTAISVNAVIWQRDLRILTAKHSAEVLNQILQDGLKVRCLCQVNFLCRTGPTELSYQRYRPNIHQGSSCVS